MQTLTLDNAERLSLPNALPDAGSLAERKTRKRLLAKVALNKEEQEEAGFAQIFEAPAAKGTKQPRIVQVPFGAPMEEIDLPKGVSPQQLEPKSVGWKKQVPKEVELSAEEVKVLRQSLELLDEPDEEGNRASEQFGAWLVDFSMKVDDLAEKEVSENGQVPA